MPRCTARCTTERRRRRRVAFSSGNSRSASITARATNGNAVSPVPARARSIARVVDRDDGQRVRRGALRREQRRRGAAAHVVERHDLVGRRTAAAAASACAATAARPGSRRVDPVGAADRAPRQARSSRRRREGARVSVTAHQGTPYTVDASASGRAHAMRMIERTDEGTLAEAVADLRAGARLALPRRPRDRAAPAEPGVLPDLGRRPRSAAARPRALTCAPATTGSSPTTATARSRSRSASRRRDAAAGGRRGRRSRVGRPADAVPLGRARPQHRQPDVVHRQPVPARGRLRGGGALHQPPPAPARAAPRTATSSRTCRSARAPRPRASSGSR